MGQQQQTVLLVTPDPGLLMQATRLFQSEGYNVVSATHSGHALLACLREPRVDVLVTEPSLEETSGRELARRLRRHHPGMRTLYFAAP